jgi:hypothetical protein
MKPMSIATVFSMAKVKKMVMIAAVTAATVTAATVIAVIAIGMRIEVGTAASVKMTVIL